MNLLDELLVDNEYIALTNSRKISCKDLKQAIRAEIDARLKEALKDYARRPDPEQW